MDFLNRLMPTRWWTRALFFLAIFFPVAIGTALWNRHSSGSTGLAEVETATADADRTDPDWRWDALNAKRPQPPAGRNGAERIPVIKQAIPKDWGRKLNSGDWDSLKTPANIRFPEDVIAEAKRECDSARVAIEAARKMGECPFGMRLIKLAPNVINTLLPDTQDTRVVVNLLQWDVVLAVEAGDKARAADSIHAMLATSRSLGDETFLISQLVRIACRTIATRSLEWALAQTELPADRLKEFEALWTADAKEPLLLYALRGERASMDVLMENLMTGAANPATWQEVGEAHRGTMNEFAWWWYRGSKLPGDRARMLAGFNALIEVARKPIDDQPREIAAFTSMKFDNEYRMHKLLFPSVEKVATATWRSAADMRCAVAGLACEVHRMQTGRWPESLAELEAAGLSAVPLDPFDGQPLRFKRLPDGVMVYSIGTDRTDDGGDLRRPDNPNGKDEGFRLWDVKERRKPAPAKPPEPKDGP